MTIAVLPGELIDIIIDSLHGDSQSLAACAMVCSDWLPRSRSHLFSTIHLWSERTQRFVEIIQSSGCTFRHHVKSLLLDYSSSHNTTINLEQQLPLHDAMPLSDLTSLLSQIQGLSIRGVDWTAIPFPAQDKLREQLAKFTALTRLELADVVFHDLRELLKIASSFPLLSHVSANIRFSTYLQYLGTILPGDEAGSEKGAVEKVVAEKLVPLGITSEVSVEMLDVWRNL